MAKLRETKKTLAESVEDLARKESSARSELDAADELLNDATTKLHDALSSTTVKKQSVNVATMMLNTAKTKRTQAMQHLDKIRSKQRSLEKTHKLLDKAIAQQQSTTSKKKKRIGKTSF